MRPEIAVPVTLALIYRAYSHRSLTPLGLVAATATAAIHARHPWSFPFVLLCVFFLGGTCVTKVKARVKAGLTLSASGASGGEGPRTHIQVLANSAGASALCLAHTYYLARAGKGADRCLPAGGPSVVFTAAIVAHYAAVAADTFSSELGILSSSQPRLITTWRTVPKGTNGGVTLWGLLAGGLGSLLIALAGLITLPFCTIAPGPVSRVLMPGEFRGWGLDDKAAWVVGMTVWGALGSVLDSILGALLQASVVERRSGKVVEGEGGGRVLVHDVEGKGEDNVRLRKKGDDGGADVPKLVESRTVVSGQDVLDNNQVNFLMAAIMSGGQILIASWCCGVSLSELFPLHT
jgi:uncharacterized protein (TIGR00297 family)